MLTELRVHLSLYKNRLIMAHHMLIAPFSRPGDPGWQDRDRMDTGQASGKGWKVGGGRAGRGEEWTRLERKDALSALVGGS